MNVLKIFNETVSLFKANRAWIELDRSTFEIIKQTKHRLNLIGQLSKLCVVTPPTP